MKLIVRGGIVILKVEFCKSKLMKASTYKIGENNFFYLTFNTT